MPAKWQNYPKADPAFPLIATLCEIPVSRRKIDNWLERAAKGELTSEQLTSVKLVPGFELECEHIAAMSRHAQTKQQPLNLKNFSTSDQSFEIALADVQQLVIRTSKDIFPLLVAGLGLSKYRVKFLADLALRDAPSLREDQQTQLENADALLRRRLFPAQRYKAEDIRPLPILKTPLEELPVMRRMPLFLEAATQRKLKTGRDIAKVLHADGVTDKNGQSQTETFLGGKLLTGNRLSLTTFRFLKHFGLEPQETLQDFEIPDTAFTTMPTAPKVPVEKLADYPVLHRRMSRLENALQAKNITTRSGLISALVDTGFSQSEAGRSVDRVLEGRVFLGNNATTISPVAQKISAIAAIEPAMAFATLIRERRKHQSQETIARQRPEATRGNLIKISPEMRMQLSQHTGMQRMPELLAAICLDMGKDEPTGLDLLKALTSTPDEEGLYPQPGNTRKQLKEFLAGSVATQPPRVSLTKLATQIAARYSVPVEIAYSQFGLTLAQLKYVPKTPTRESRPLSAIPVLHYMMPEVEERIVAEGGTSVKHIEAAVIKAGENSVKANKHLNHIWAGRIYNDVNTDVVRTVAQRLCDAVGLPTEVGLKRLLGKTPEQIVSEANHLAELDRASASHAAVTASP